MTVEQDAAHSADTPMEFESGERGLTFHDFEVSFYILANFFFLIMEICGEMCKWGCHLRKYTTNSENLEKSRQIGSKSMEWP